MLRFMAKTRHANDPFMMFPEKKYISLFQNILYFFLILFLVFWVYNIVNLVLNQLMHTPDGVHFGVEPVFFGLITLAMDMLLIKMKRTMQRIVADARQTAAQKR